jgi:hypothetical protein
LHASARDANGYPTQTISPGLPPPTGRVQRCARTCMYGEGYGPRGGGAVRMWACHGFIKAEGRTLYYCKRLSGCVFTKDPALLVNAVHTGLSPVCDGCPASVRSPVRALSMAGHMQPAVACCPCTGRMNATGGVR